MFVIASKRRKKKQTDFSAAQYQEIHRIISESTCSLAAYRDKRTGQMLGIHINFTGELAHFPSTSNDRQIFYRTYTDKLGRKRSAPFNGRSVTAQMRLAAAKEQFLQAVANSGYELPCFFDARVRIVGLFAQKSGRWDVHNQIKPMCDWIQDVGIITDDVNARVLAERKDDWPQAYPDYQTTTTILILPESRIGSLVPATVGEMRLVSTGKLELIG